MLKNGFGFIKTETGDIFFHANNLVDVEYDDLEEGMTLRFELGEGRDGKEQAVEITVVEDAAA